MPYLIRCAMTTHFVAGLKTLLLLFVVVQLSAAEGIDAKKAKPAKAEAQPAAKNAPLKSQVFEGQVLPLTEIVKKQSAAADEDALKVSRVLKTDDGKVFTLVKDDASRKFFLDDRLLRRPMKFTAVQVPGTQILVLTQAQSILKGKLHDVDYWCEKCQLSATEPGLCKCCGKLVELRELPVEPKPSIPSPTR